MVEKMTIRTCRIEHALEKDGSFERMFGKIEDYIFRPPMNTEDRISAGDYKQYIPIIEIALKENTTKKYQKYVSGLIEGAKQGACRMENEDAGFVYDFPCYHGIRKELPQYAFYNNNNFNSNILKISGVVVDGGICKLVIGCKICNENLYTISVEELKYYSVEENKNKYYVDYMNNINRKLGSL